MTWRWRLGPKIQWNSCSDSVWQLWQIGRYGKAEWKERELIPDLALRVLFGLWWLGSSVWDRWSLTSLIGTSAFQINLPLFKSPAPPEVVNPILPLNFPGKKHDDDYNDDDNDVIYLITRSLGPVFGPSGLLDFVLRALRPCDPRNCDWIVC